MSIGQKKEISNFLTTTAVAWFTAGVIAPLFTFPETEILFKLSLTLGLTMTAVFLIVSVIISKDI